MNILITGAAGYLGKHLIDKIPSGQTVLLDRSINLKERFPNHACYVSELDSIPEIIEILNSNSISSIIHLAALKSVSDSIANPELTIASNLVSTFNLLEASRQSAVKSFIFASSAAVYSAPTHYEPLRETDETIPNNPYGVSKLICERLIFAYAETFNVASLRFFNLIGSSNSANVDRSGENFLPIALRAIENGSPLTIFGNAYRTDDGFAVRDFIDVRDASDALIKTLDLISKDQTFEPITINIGSNVGTSLYTILSLLNELAPGQLQIHIADAREGEVPYVVSDSTKGSELLGWFPNYSISKSISDDFENYFN